MHAFRDIVIYSTFQRIKNKQKKKTISTFKPRLTQILLTASNVD